MLGKTFKEEGNFVKWLKASNDIVEIQPLGVTECVGLDIILVFKAEELNSSAKSNSSLE